MAEAFGFGTLDYTGLETEAGGFDWVVNTVPARVISDAALCLMATYEMLKVFKKEKPATAAPTAAATATVSA